MKHISGFLFFITRLLITSALALCCQIFLVVKYPDYLLVVQEAIKKASVTLFTSLSMDSSYRVAYNLLNGDGIVVHTVFVLLAFAVIYLLLTPVRALRQ